MPYKFLDEETKRQIEEFVAANPKLPARAVAAKFEVTKSRVYSICKRHHVVMSGRRAALIEAEFRNNPHITHAEVSQRLDIAVATVHKVAAEMERRGFSKQEIINVVVRDIQLNGPIAREIAKAFTTRRDKAE